jgi:carbamate kinase
VKAGQKKTLLIALGGNALIRKGQKGTIEEQFENLRGPLRQIARLSLDYRLIITHGNGPQVGDLLLRQECCESVERLPLEILVAQTQGQIGYMIESMLDSELMELGLDSERYFVTLLSYVLVDENDPAFQNPTKPIGPVLPEDSAAKLPYPTVRTHKGYRRVVASPEPLTIIEKREIKKLTRMGFIVITCGGGGIPVIREGRSFAGVNAVIDKDLASAKLAEEVGVDIFIIATDVGGVALHYGTPEQEFVEKLTLSDAAKHLQDGQFPAGSMEPKVQACMRFLQCGGERSVIASIDEIEAAVKGRSGTEFIKDSDQT